MGRYLAYLRSDEWQTKRAAVIERCSNICEVCELLPVEEVHHNTYERLYREELDDLLGVCSHCHERVHRLTTEGGEIVAAMLRTLPESNELVERLENEMERFLDPQHSWKYWKRSSDADIHELKDELTADRRLLYGNWECELIGASVSGDELSVRLQFRVGGQPREIRMHNLAQRFRSGTLRLDYERHLFVDVGYLADGLRILAGPILPPSEPEKDNRDSGKRPVGPPTGDPAIEVERLVVSILELSRRSANGWVTWTDVCLKQCGPIDLLMAYADLPEWRKLIAVGRGGVVKLTREGVKFARDSVARNRTRPPFTNSCGITFVWIRHGIFLMGSPPDEKEREANEVQHEIRLSNGCFMGIHPVSQAQWKTVMGTNPSRFQDDTLPVEQVSWHECHEFCKKMTEMDGKPYRLPTETEWEYACRAGTTTPFHFGQTLSTDQANFDGKYVYGDGEEGTYRQRTTPVGRFPPNAWGLYDLHGNVWEWCSDWYGIYPTEDSVDYQGPMNGTERIIRGGAWNQIPRRCRSAHRDRAEPTKRRKDVGCRICFSED